MRKYLQKGGIILIGITLGIALNVSVVFAVPIVHIQPSTATVLPGDIFSLDVAISDVVDLFAFQFDLGFDPTILVANSISEGPFLSTGGPTFFIPGIIDNQAGSITFNAGTLLGPIPGVTGSGTLATVSFNALALGESPITLANLILLDSSLSTIPFSTEGGLVSVVPEPATLLLLGSGLTWLAIAGKRIRRYL